MYLRTSPIAAAPPAAFTWRLALYMSFCTPSSKAKPSGVLSNPLLTRRARTSREKAVLGDVFRLGMAESLDSVWSQEPADSGYPARHDAREFGGRAAHLAPPP